MTNIIREITPAFTNIFLQTKRIIFNLFNFIDSHFTYLLIFLIVVIGTVLNFIFCYIFRYSRYSYKNWKSRALFKSITLCFSLILIKGVFQIIL